VIEHLPDLTQIPSAEEALVLIRRASSPDLVRGLTTAGLRDQFLVPGLTADAEPRFAYTDHDRLVIGGVRPGEAVVALPAPDALGTEHFLDRRELGVVNLGRTGRIVVDGTEYEIGNSECIYIGRGARDVNFAGDGAVYYLVSTRAHRSWPTVLVTQAEAEPVQLGGPAGSNQRTIYKYIHAGGAASCELVLGVTVLADGSMWNTMPCHIHERRTEVYFYFGLPDGQRVVHLMGEPTETRNLIVANEQAVISPPWSVHCGFGTHSYAFVWAMGGENQDYGDVETIPLERLR
jgi:4-deoxy-L-threo-5-hexosulose-uronate ketol-isomerase